MDSRIVLRIICFIFIATQHDLGLMGQELEKNNPDSYLNTLQIIEKYGYPAESHLTRTEDGYFLELHRIPRGKDSEFVEKRPPIFLQHGLFGSSADFVLIGPGKALPFLLADEGYDVWLGNVRGNTYSRAHETLASNDRKFWDFTWHESGIYDIPAQIDYICNYTDSDKILYVGHSMGTTMLFVMTSMRPEYQEKIQGAVLFAAVAYLENTRSPIRVLAPFANDIEVLLDILSDGEFVQQSALYRFLASLVCSLTTSERELCTNIIFSLVGFDAEQFNTTILQNFLYHLPAGTSTKTVVHYAQLIQSGKFQQFDYGKDNIKRYGRTTPPDYDLKAITTPMYIFEGQNDLLSTLTDVQRLAKQMENVEVNIIEYPHFNHLDFIVANDVKTLLYDKVLDQMSVITNNFIETK